jgi:hypothetical protein
MSRRSIAVLPSQVSCKTAKALGVDVLADPKRDS